MLRPEGFAVSDQTERMLDPESEPVGEPYTLEEENQQSLPEDLMEDVKEYVNNPPPETPPVRKSPVQEAVDQLLIGNHDENYKTLINKLTPEGRDAIRGMASRVLGKDFTGDINEYYYCTTFISDMLNSLGADPLDDKGDEYNRTRANAYMKYGTPVDIEDIQEGDIVIFDFPKMPDGSLTLDPTRGKRNGRGDHATFYAGDRLEVNKPGSNYVGVLGGEQGPDAAISMKAFDKSHILGIRRIQYDDIDYNFTKELAKVNPDFNKFLDEQAKQFDFNAFMEEYSDPIQGNNRLTSGFKEGGAVMQRQMEMAFMNEGGLKDDGLETDPVSGNEIPNGSLAEEVRDDIPAQLSEGEYVVPADVVRFYGVKFFEDLRMEAKRGLAEMESNGRIGGEPVPAGGPQVNEAQVTDQEMSALRELAMEMNQGGYVQHMNKGGTVLGFQDAGDTGTTVDAAQAVQSQPIRGGGLGFSLFGPYTSDTSLPTGFGDDTGDTPFREGEVVELFKDGQVLSFVMMRDYQKYLDKIAEGWLTKIQKDKLLIEQGPSIEGPGTDDTTTTTDTGETTAVTDTSNDRTDYRQFSTDSKPTLTKNVADMTDDELKVAMEGMNIVGRTGSTLAYTMGLPLGAIVGSQLASRYNNMLEVARDRNIISSKEYEDRRKGSIFGGEKSLFDNLIDRSDKNKELGTSNKKGVDFGDTWLGDLLGFDGKAGVDGPGLRESFGGARRNQTAIIPSIQDTSAADNQTAAEEAMGRTTSTAATAPSTQAEKTAAANTAVSNLQAAQQRADAASGSDDIREQYEANMARAEASREATRAIQEASGWSGGFFGSASNPNWRDAAAEGGLMSNKKKKKKK